MANLLDNVKTVGMCVARLTPRQNDCSFLAGANAWVIPALSDLTVTPEYGTIGEIDETDLSGASCFNNPETSYLKYYTVEATFCNICPAALAAFTSMTSYTDGTDVVAYSIDAAANKGRCDTTSVSKFVLELFAKAQDGSSGCSPASASFVRYTLPLLYDVKLNEIPFTNDASTKFSFSAKAMPDNGAYGNGPFNDFAGGTLAEGAVFAFEALPPATALPSPSCTPVLVPAQV